MRSISRGAVVGLILASGVSACASESSARVQIFEGSDGLLAALTAQANECGYPGIERTLGSHLQPVAILQIPSRGTAQFQCVEAWVVEHRSEFAAR